MPIITHAGWAIDEDTNKSVFLIEIECRDETDVPEFPISWVGEPVKITVERQSE